MRICLFSRRMTQHRAYYVTPPVLLIRTFAAIGHEVTALTTSLPDGNSGVFSEDTAAVRYLSGTSTGEVDEKFWRESAACFDKIHEASPFDIVIGRGTAIWGFLKFSRFAGQIPAICHEGTYPLLSHQLERRMPKLVPLLAKPTAVLWSMFRQKYRDCLIRADRVVCNSPALAKTLAKISWKSAPRTEFIPYGFDLEPYQTASAEIRQFVPPRLIFVGRMTWDKGVLAMVEILAKLERKDVLLEAIGPCSDKVRRAMMTRAAKLGVQDRLLLTGPVHNTRLPQRLVGAFAFLFPSTHPEGLNKTVMEAMSAALPVVAYDMPGMDILVQQGKTGWLVPSRDTSAAAAKLDALLADPKTASQMGKAGRALIAEGFAPASVTSMWEELLKDVVAERAKAR
jgi:glycosyltransferase involved in cell wall biosynthesis